MDLVRFVFCSVLVTVTSTRRDKRASICALDNLDIPNGSYELKSGTSIVLYTCDRGFVLYGNEKLYCIASSWTSFPPKCITNTCQAVEVKEPLRVQKEYNGSLLRFSCAVMNKLDGVEDIICDGTAWSAPTPTCTPMAPATSCGFEDATLCGWIHHDDSDVKWRLIRGSTKTSRTGPQYDHTYGDGGKGRYMYFETSSPTRTGHKAMLLSPLYPKSYSRRCFKFWYHILAVGDVAVLEVFIKPETQIFDDLTAVFSVNENKGDVWLSHRVLVEQIDQPFQILIVATRGSSFRSDIAIDDVMLYPCQEYFPTTTTTTTTAVSTTTTTEFIPTTISSTARPHIPTTMPLTSVSPSSTVTTQHKTMTSSSTSTQRQTAIGTTIFRSSSTIPQSVTSTVAPIINPNVPVKQSKVIEKGDNSSNLIYILVGVGLVLAVTIAVGVGIYFCKRRNSGYSMDSNGAVNPLYSAMANDEAIVHFANDTE